MKNEKFKKFFAVFTALCLVLSVTLCLFPPLEVKASETINIKNTPFYNLIPKGDQLFDLQYYDISSASDLSDEIKYGCNDSIIPADGRAYYNFLPDFITFLNDKDNNSTQFNGGEPFNSINIVTNNSGLIDYLQNPNNYYSLVTITMNSTTFSLSVFYSDSNFLDNVYCTNGGGATFSYNGTIKRFEISFLISNDTSHSAISPNVFTQSNSGSFPYMSSGYYLCYCTCPLYFVYASNQYGSTYSNLNSSSNIRNFLANGDTSPFLIDRRDYFSNYSGNNDLTAENDPMSIDYSGAWDLDLVPVNDLITGQIMVKYAPSEKLVEENPNYRVKYWFQFMGSTTPITMNDVVHRPQYFGAFCSIYGIKATDVGQYKFDFNNYYTVKSSSYWETLSNEYNSYNASTVLGTMYPKIGSFVYKNLTNTEYIEPYDALRFYKYMNWYSQTTGISGNASFGSVSIGASSSGGQISTLKLTVYAQAFAGDTPITNVANTTYNYLDGSITKVGTVSTNNNTPVDSVTGVPEGLTPKEYQDIQDTTNDINTSGNITGGNNTNSNTNNPTFNNNNNPTITINNNNGLTEPDGVPDDPSEGSFSMLWSIWESYHFAEWLNQDLQGNGFLHYIFSSEIWDLPIFNLIIPALAILITVSIASTIIRFIRGN